MADLKRAVGYLRKSTECNSRQIESLEGQERMITRFAKDNDYVVTRWYRESFTGTEARRRKVFLRMLEDAAARPPAFSYVLCYDISRFGRLDNDETGHYRYLFRQAGVEIVYVAENLRGDDTDDLILSTRQWLAREHSRKIGELVCRNIASRSRRAEIEPRGFNIGRAAPFGYDTVYLDHAGEPHTVVRLLPDRSKEVYDTAGGLLRILPRSSRFRKASTDRVALVPSHPDRVAAVRKIFAQYVLEGRGLYGIVNRLNEDLRNGIGSPSARGKPWSVGSVQQILKNEHYIGNTVFNKRSMGRFFRLASRTDSLEPVRLPKHLATMVRENPRSDWIVIEGTHEPLVSRDLFLAAQRIRPVRNTGPSRRGRPRKSKYIFSGLLTCRSCGFRFHGQTKRKKKGTSAWEAVGYVCGGYKTRGRSTCSSIFLRELVLEECVVKAIERELPFWIPPRGWERECQPEMSCPDSLLALEYATLVVHFRREWARASVGRKREILSLLCRSISICSERKDPRCSEGKFVEVEWRPEFLVFNKVIKSRQ